MLFQADDFEVQFEGMAVAIKKMEMKQLLIQPINDLFRC